MKYAAFLLAFVALMARAQNEKPITSLVATLPKVSLEKSWCADTVGLKKNLGDEFDDSYVAGSAPDAKARFAYFDKATRAIVACEAGKVTAAGRFVNEALEDYENVRISDISFDDYDGDGKPELLATRRQCAEGPCLGNPELIHLEGGTLKKSTRLRAELVALGGPSTKRYLKLTIICFDHEFGQPFDHFVIAEFVRGGLKSLSTKEVRGRYPDLVNEYSKGATASLADAKKAKGPDAKAKLLRARVHELIAAAYRGEPRIKLVDAYSKIVAGDDQALAVHCDPRAILESLTE